MNRRTFLNAAAIAGAAWPAAGQAAAQVKLTALPPLPITRVRFYHNPQSPPSFNQSYHIVTVETSEGITGIGEGGSKDAVEQCAAMMIDRKSVV